MADAKHLTQAQAAALLGVTTRRLRQIAQDGDAPPAYLDAAGNVAGYPCEAFGQWMRARWAREIGAADDGAVYDEKLERARLLHHQANNEALKEQVNRGELIPAPLVRELCSGLAVAIRAKVLAIHSKLRSRFPAIDKDVADEVQSLSREALQELADDGLPDDLRRRLA